MPCLFTLSFRNLLTSAGQQRVAKRDEELGQKGYVPTAKKFFNSTMFQNSKEFTQLGTLAKENRTAEYYQPDIPTQPKPLQDPNDLSYLTRKHPIGSQLRQENIDVMQDNQRLEADKKQRTEAAARQEADLFIKNTNAQGAAGEDNYDFLRMEYMKDQFPRTTNQEFINNEYVKFLLLSKFCQVVTVILSFLGCMRGPDPKTRRISRERMLLPAM